MKGKYSFSGRKQFICSYTLPIELAPTTPPRLNELVLKMIEKIILNQYAREFLNILVTLP